jgi:hypothetical protein
MIDAAQGRFAWALKLGLFVFFFREPLLERFDALGDIPHDVGNLALAAENDQYDGPDYEPMPDRQTAHGVNLQFHVRRPKAARRCENLGFREHKNKVARAIHND